MGTTASTRRRQVSFRSKATNLLFGIYRNLTLSCNGTGHRGARQYFSPTLTPIGRLARPWRQTMLGKNLGIGGGYDYSGASGLPAAKGPARSSLIDARLTITGNLDSEGDLQVDGRVQGRVRCQQLIVGTDATIDGDIVAAEVVVRGKVKGVIRADRVQLQEAARVESEIIFEKSVGIDEGASFEGEIRRGSGPSPAVAMSIGGPLATNSATIDEAGLAPALSDNPTQDTRIVCKSQPRRLRATSRDQKTQTL